MQIMSQAWLVGAVSAALLAPAAQAGGLRSLRSAGAVDQAAADAAMDAELAVGAGPTDARIARLEAELNATFTALPKDDEGGLGHQAVRYALHRLFVQRHGWYVKGLEPGTSSPGADGWVPSYLEGRLRSHLSGKGAALRDLALFAAAIEDLVTREAAGMMRATYEMLELPTGGNLTQEEAQQLVSTFFVAFLRAGNFSASSPGDALAKVGVFQRKYKGWSEASDWLRGAVATVAGSSSLEGGLDLAGAERLAVEIGERYHAFNDMECKALKTEMEGLQVHKAGRVRLPHFYRKGLYSHWEFNEKASYLRTLGALDESEEGNTMVIMPNYLMARTNCLEATNMYALCCRNECEDLMDQLEVDVAAPEAEPKRLAELVAAMPSDTVAAPRNLSAALLSRLEEVAASNGGKVPLHGRLFAQWMHHAFPRECPYPHEHGTTSPQTPDEWMRETGEATDKMTESELLREVEADTCAWVPGEAPGAGCGDPGELPWSEAEELLTVALPEAHSRPRPLLGFAAPTHPAALGEGWDTAAAEAKAGEGTRHSGLAAVLAAALAAAAGLDRGYFGPRRRSARGLLDGEPEGAAAGALAAAWPMAEGHRVPALLCALALAAYSVELLDGGVCVFGAGAGVAVLVARARASRAAASRLGGGRGKKLYE